MSKKPTTLQELSYKAIPHKVYQQVRNTPSLIKEQSVLQYVKADITRDHTTFNKWVKSIKIPKEANDLLVIIDHFTKPDFCKAYRNIQKKANGIDYDHHSDYLDSILVFLDDKNLFDERISREEQEQKWKKHHHIVMMVYNILCYKRLNDIFEVDYMFGDKEKNLLDTYIMNLPENELLPYIIYHFVNRNKFMI